MNDHYLWDKSGEPDEEIQQLESLLSEFRYQPRPLVLPEDLPKRSIFAALMPFFTMRYAAVAAMALLALSAGLWFFTRSTPSRGIVAQLSTTTPTPQVVNPVAPPEQPVAPTVQAPQLVRHFAAPKPAPRLVKHHSRSTSKTLEAEGEMAKEKVLYALQVTSKQLDLISRKIQTDTN